MTISAQWWGFSTAHGFVILDRELPGNSPGTPGDLLFFRCRDSKVFSVKREQWRHPAYQYAPNYVSAQPPAMTADTAAELKALMERWPEFQLDIRRQHKAIADERELESRAAAKLAKTRAQETKKQRATTEGFLLAPTAALEQ